MLHFSLLRMEKAIRDQARVFVENYMIKSHMHVGLGSVVQGDF